MYLHKYYYSHYSLYVRAFYNYYFFTEDFLYRHAPSHLSECQQPVISPLTELRNGFAYRFRYYVFHSTILTIVWTQTNKWCTPLYFQLQSLHTCTKNVYVYVYILYRFKFIHVIYLFCFMFLIGIQRIGKMTSTASEDRPFIFRVNENGTGPALLIQVKFSVRLTNLVFWEPMSISQCFGQSADHFIENP